MWWFEFKGSNGGSCIADDEARELFVTDIQGSIDDLTQTVDGVDVGREELIAEVQELKTDMGELRHMLLGTLREELAQRHKPLEAMVAAMRAEIAELKGKLAESEATRVKG